MHMSVVDRTAPALAPHRSRRPAVDVAGRIAAGGLAIAAIALPALAMAQGQAAAALAPVPDKGDVAWLLTSVALVLLMILPGLALFYGGLVRTKNMLSVLTQVMAVAALAMILWVMAGYGLAFGGDANAFVSAGKWMLAGVTPDSTVATFTDGVVLPELLFIAFQMCFAAITAALVIGGLVERMRFSALMAVIALWLFIVYAPLAHMVWYLGGDDASTGLLFGWGALDFAGGTVVHINAGVTALVGAMMLGPRIGYQREAMAPHSLVMTVIGTGLLWVGWAGFNAGSALEANASAALALINTLVATAAGLLFWMLTERALGHRGSALGACSGAIAGLVAVTPAAGNAGPFGAILIGAITSVICALFVVKYKPRLKLDDPLDAFGIHGLGGIVGSVLTAFTMAPALGGPGDADYDIGAQLGIQLAAVGVSVAWVAIGAAICFGIVKAVMGLRVTADDEREGLDLVEHGERAYNP